MGKIGGLGSLRTMFLWLALIVALLSALMTAGLPRSTHLGSAFDPATIAVALKPDPLLAIDRTVLTRASNGAGDLAAHSLLPVALVTIAVVAMRPALRIIPSYAIGVPAVPISFALYARVSVRGPPRH